MDFSNSTELLPSSDYGVLPTGEYTTTGLPKWFTPRELDIVHSIAVGSLSVSLAFSLGVVSYMVYTGRDREFYQRKIAERLVFYLALCDLGFSTEHIIDHVYLLIHHQFPPDLMCSILAFFLQGFSTMQGVIILFTAVNACALIWREERLNTGRYDWKLLSASIILPVVQGGVCCAIGGMGPSLAWCGSDRRKWWTIYVDLFYAIEFVLVFITVLVCYGLVLCKIRRISHLLSSTSDSAIANLQSTNRRHSTMRSARIMCIFILAYIFQWFGFMTYSLWSLHSPAPVWLLALTVLVTNLGGTYNCIAYTIVRKSGVADRHSSSPKKYGGVAYSHSTEQRYNLDTRKKAPNNTNNSDHKVLKGLGNPGFCHSNEKDLQFTEIAKKTIVSNAEKERIHSEGHPHVELSNININLE